MRIPSALAAFFRGKNRKLFGLLLLPLVFAVYYPGLSGGFVFDDGANLLDNQHLHLDELSWSGLREAALSGNAGLALRPVSSLSFALDHYFTGRFDPFYLRLVNLLIHLLNGASVFAFTCLLLRAYTAYRPDTGYAAGQCERVAFVVAAGWLLHPLALTSVLYAVQRMNSLSALFTLWGLSFYLWGRLRMAGGKSGLPLMAGGIVGFGTLATLSKENGALIALYALLIETVLLRFQTQPAANRRALLSFAGVVLVLPVAGAAIYFVSQWDWVLGSYNTRTFTLTERLLTESSVLWLYLKWIALPNNAGLGLFHDDIPVSTGILSPPTTLAAVIGLVVLAAAAAGLARKAPLLSFGILWYLVGHSMESSFFALELVHEHRNYLPMYGILLIVFHALTREGRNAKLTRFRRGAAALLIVLFGATTALRAMDWGNDIVLYQREVEHHPQSSRAHYQAGIQYGLLLLQDKNNSAFHMKADYHFKESQRLDKSSTNGLFGLIYLSHTAGRPLEPWVLGELSYRLRHYPFTGFNMTSFRNLVIWQQNRYTHLSDKEVMTLFDAALENPDLAKGAWRALIFSLMSAYYVNVVHSPGDAVALALKAVELAPKEALFNMSLAQLLVSLRQYGAAREQLGLARANDRLGVFNREIEETEKELRLHRTEP